MSEPIASADEYKRTKEWAERFEADALAALGFGTPMSKLQADAMFSKAADLRAQMAKWEARKK